ncbi:MAG: AAA family ATPase [Verrucomicrobia bacterium]|nr:AAA family ATPase [Verrucomicrobiota bacterium]
MELGRLNVLIGANGTGKSNLVSLFAFLNAAMKGELQIFVGRTGAAHSLLHLGPKQTGELTGTLEFDNDEESAFYAFKLLFAAPDNLIFASETFRTVPKPPKTSSCSELIARGANESAVAQPGFQDNEWLKWFASLISGLRSFHFHDTSLLARIRGHSRAADHRVLYQNGENLASVLRFLRDAHPEHYQRILETVRLIAPFFADFVLEAPTPSPELVMLNWRAKGADYEFGPHQLSDGTLRFTALATLLLLPMEMLPGMIVIDEPELGLHPYAIKLLASLLAEASARTQVLVATQSAALVDEVEPNEVIVANLEGGATSFERLDSEKLSDWLKEYTLSQMWETNLFGGRP